MRSQRSAAWCASVMSTALLGRSLARVNRTLRPVRRSNLVEASSSETSPSEVVSHGMASSSRRADRSWADRDGMSEGAVAATRSAASNCESRSIAQRGPTKRDSLAMAIWSDMDEGSPRGKPIAQLFMLSGCLATSSQAKRHSLRRRSCGQFARSPRLSTGRRTNERWIAPHCGSSLPRLSACADRSCSTKSPQPARQKSAWSVRRHTHICGARMPPAKYRLMHSCLMLPDWTGGVPSKR